MSNLAGYLKIPTFIVALTIVAFGTSTPELAISFNSILNNNGALTLSNVVGANVVNVLLVLGVAALVKPIKITNDDLEKEITFRIGKLSFLKNNEKELHELQEQLKIIEDNKEKILNKIGLTKNDLTPQYRCKKCKDTGFIRGFMCDCYKKERNYAIIKECGIDKNELVSFEDIDESLIKITINRMNY